MSQGTVEDRVEDAVFSLPEGTLVDVKLTVRLPAGATEKQGNEWLHHTISQQGSICVDNPLYRHAPEAWGPFGLAWTDTGDTGREEQYDHEKTGPNSSTFRVRYLRERRN